MHYLHNEDIGSMVSFSFHNRDQVHGKNNEIEKVKPNFSLGYYDRGQMNRKTREQCCPILCVIMGGINSPFLCFRHVDLRN